MPEPEALVVSVFQLPCAFLMTAGAPISAKRLEPARLEAYEQMDIMNLAFMGYSLRRFCLPPIICTPDIFLSRQCVADMGSLVLGPNCRMSQGSSPSGGVALTTSIMLWAPWLLAVVEAGTTQLTGLDLSLPLMQWNSHA